jgi:hypothetical protein
VIVENCSRLYDSALRDARYPALFSPDFTAHLLGMFELNCLGITVESPVEDLRDEMRSARKREGGGAEGAATREGFRGAEAVFKMLGSADVPCDVRAPRSALQPTLRIGAAGIVLVVVTVRFP